jgi:hypothetical protein
LSQSPPQLTEESRDELANRLELITNLLYLAHNGPHSDIHRTLADVQAHVDCIAVILFGATRGPGSPPPCPPLA